MCKITAWVIIFLGFYLAEGNRWSKLNVLYQWKQLEFDYPTEEDRQDAIKSEAFKPGQILPIDVEIYKKKHVHQQDKFFITIPRFQAGVPVTLGTVTDKLYQNNPIIAPYPSWDWQNFTGCKPNRLVSVFRVAIDKHDRLWVLDSAFGLENVECPPQLLVFDLKTDKLLYRYEFPKSQYTENSTFVTPIVDVGTNCDDTYVYSGDCVENSILVYDLKNNASWLVKDKSMNPSPLFTNFTLAGFNYTSTDGILGMALTPPLKNGQKYLYYHPLASQTETRVSTAVLKNRDLFENNPSASPESFTTYSPGRGTQSAAEVFDQNGILYFGMLSDITIDCWNIRTNYTRANFRKIATNREELQFPSGMKINGIDLYVMTSRFHRMASGTLNASEVNFRILTGNTQSLTQKSICKPFNRH